MDPRVPLLLRAGALSPLASDYAQFRAHMLRELSSPEAALHGTAPPPPPPQPPPPPPPPLPPPPRQQQQQQQQQPEPLLPLPTAQGGRHTHSLLPSAGLLASSLAQLVAPVHAPQLQLPAARAPAAAAQGLGFPYVDGGAAASPAAAEDASSLAWRRRYRPQPLQPASPAAAAASGAHWQQGAAAAYTAAPAPPAPAPAPPDEALLAAAAAAAAAVAEREGALQRAREAEAQRAREEEQGRLAAALAQLQLQQRQLQQQLEQQQHLHQQRQQLAEAQAAAAAAAAAAAVAHSPKRLRSSLLEAAGVPPLTARTAQLLSDDILVLLQRLQQWGREGAGSGSGGGARSATEAALAEACAELQRTVGAELRGLMVAELEILSRPARGCAPGGEGAGEGEGAAGAAAAAPSLALPPPVPQHLSSEQLGILRGSAPAPAPALAPALAPAGSLQERQERQALGQRIADVLLHGSAEEALEALGRLPRPRQVGQH